MELVNRVVSEFAKRYQPMLRLGCRQASAHEQAKEHFPSLRTIVSVLLAVYVAAFSINVFPQTESSPASQQLPAEAGAEQVPTSVDGELLERIDAVDSMRVVMHSQEPGARLANQLESLFSALGVDNIELRYVEQVPDTIQVRVFHSADGQAAKVVSDVLSLVFDDVSTRALEDYQPSPAEGLVEIWLPDYR